MAACVGDSTCVVAVPFVAATDGSAVFDNVALSRLELRVGEEHDHAVAAATGPTAAAATREFWTLVGADDRAVRFEDLDGVAVLRVDFQRRLGADVLRGVAGATARANAGATCDFELVPVAVEAFLGRARAVGDVEAAVDVHGAVGVGAVVGIAAGVVDAAVDGEVLGRIHRVVLHRIRLDVAAIDGQRGLAFDALAAFVLRLGAVDDDGAAVDGQVAATLDALGVGIVATTARRPSAATA